MLAGIFAALAGYRVSRATIYRALAAADLAALPADTGG